MRIWDGRVENGKLKLEDRDGFAALVEKLEGKPIQITLERMRVKRSNNQNRWYWGCIVKLLAEHCGYETDEMHEALKAKFLRDRENEEVGGLPKIRSSASLDTVQFSDYCERCRQLGAEMGVIIPAPDEI